MLSATEKELVRSSIGLFQDMLEHVNKALTAAKLRSNLPESLKQTIKKLSTVDNVDDLLMLTADERVSWLIDHASRVIDQAAGELENDDDGDDVIGDDAWLDRLVKRGEAIDAVRLKVLRAAGRNAKHDVTPNLSYASALDYLGAQLVAAGADLIVATPFRTKSVGERLRIRKQHARWLKTSAGRAYRRKQALRRKLHKRKDPKRVKLMRQVHNRYHY
jgi:hypothetical protein